MAMKTAQPRGSGALDRIRQLRAKWEVEDPAFRAASQLEQGAEAFNQAAREDIKRQRRKLGWDQAQLGAALGYTQSAISKIESGQAELTLSMLYRLSDAMGLRPVIAFVPSARALSGGEIGQEAPQAERLLHSARAVEAAQAEMIRRMPQMMEAMVELVNLEGEGAEPEVEAAAEASAAAMRAE